MRIHNLKIEPEYLAAIEKGDKTFEVRLNDRDYKVGDVLTLRSYEGEQYTGREVLVLVKYMTDYAQQEGYVVMSLESVPDSFIEYVKLSDKEKFVFKKFVKHLVLYGYGNREVSNMIWEVFDELVSCKDLSDFDMKWYRDYWNRGEADES